MRFSAAFRLGTYSSTQTISLASPSLLRPAPSKASCSLRMASDATEGAIRRGLKPRGWAAALVAVPLALLQDACHVGVCDDDHMKHQERGKPQRKVPLFVLCRKNCFRSQGFTPCLLQPVLLEVLRPSEKPVVGSAVLMRGVLYRGKLDGTPVIGDLL